MSSPTQSHSPVAAENDQLREEVREYVQALRVFRVHAAVFAAGMVVILGVNLFTNMAAGITGEWSAWWSGWALLGWGLGIAVHGLVVRQSRPGGSSTAWEDKQIDKILTSIDPETNR